jgi:hypothetical protein
VSSAGRLWVAMMPTAVNRQRHMLAAMLDAVELEPALRWFELGCSLGRGAGDALSDIDCAVGVRDFARAPELASVLSRAVSTPIADEMRQIYPGLDGQTCWHVFTLYDDGAQLSLVLMPAAWRTGLPPGSVALHDADGQLASVRRPDSADVDAATLREWVALGWIALGDLAKYLDRGSLWEAHQRLEAARGEFWKVWAAGSGVDFPGYGLTAILDEAVPPLAPGVASTVAGLDADDLRAAARHLADLLAAAVVRVEGTLRQAGLTAPAGLQAFAVRRLA